MTGANRGIGRAIAERLAEQGIRVIVGSRDCAAGEAVAEKIRGRALQLDATDRAGIEKAMSDLGQVDVLVNNAGVLRDGGLFDDSDDLDRCLDVMVRGPFHHIRLLEPGMEARGYGRIVNVPPAGALSQKAWAVRADIASPRQR